MSFSSDYSSSDREDYSSVPAAERFEVKYCSICDKYFYSKALLQAHIQQTPAHPRCKECNRRFLNKNSRRNHYVCSSRHHYCRSCDKLFKSAVGMQIHFDQSLRHSGDSDEEEAEDTRPSGWEDEVALQLDAESRANQTEEPVHVAEQDRKHVTKVQRTAAMMTFMAQRMRAANAGETGTVEAHSYSCPVCLACPKTVAATRCGHLFCAPCINRAVETNGACPTCRAETALAHIRNINLGKY